MTIKKRKGFRGQTGIDFSGVANYTDGRSMSGDDVLAFTDKLTELIESLGMEWGGGAHDIDLDDDELWAEVMVEEGEYLDVWQDGNPVFARHFQGHYAMRAKREPREGS